MSLIEKSKNPYVYPSLELDYTESAIQCRTVFQGQNEGITLLDHFASQVASGLMSATNSDGEWTAFNCSSDVATQSYDVASEMLKERQKYLQ